MLRQALCDNPAGVDLLNSIGVNYMTRGKFVWAERRLRLALKANPTCNAVKNNLAEALMSQGRFTDALDCLNSIDDAEGGIERKHYPLVLWNRARVYCRIGEYGRACAAFALLRELLLRSRHALKYEAALPYLASTAYFEGRYVDSAEFSRQWAKSGQRYELGLVWAASAYRRAGMPDAATEVLRSSTFTDRYNRSLTELMCDELSAERLLALYPERRAEIECYLGEHAALQDTHLAAQHWQHAIAFGHIRTFEHLRASRQLEDVHRFGLRVEQAR